MAKKKEVKQSADPQSSKTSKAAFDPIRFKTLNVCWQIGNIDFEGENGYFAFSEKVKFHFSDELISEIGLDGFPEDLYDALLSLDQANFGDVGSFLRQLNEKTKEPILKKHIKIVVSYLNRYYFKEKIYPKLKEFETKTWADLDDEKFGRKGKSKHHFIDVSTLSSNAKKRLKELRIDEDQLYSLRLEGDLRIFGIQRLNYLSVLWVDQNHNVCPVGD